jgi:hypothetical protein
MIPRIIHQTSRHLTPEESRLGARMRAKLPGWEYRLWSDEENQALVDERFPQHAVIFRNIKRGVVKADIARYMYLAAFGGFYFDTDYKLVRPLEEQMLSYACVLPISRSSGTLFRLGNAVMGSEANHPFWTDFIDHIFLRVELSDLAEDNIEKTTGPEGLTDFYLDRRHLYGDIYLPPRETFHPPLTQFGFSFLKGKTTVGAHLCWGSWRSKGPLGLVRALAVRKLTSI